QMRVGMPDMPPRLDQAADVLARRQRADEQQEGLGQAMLAADRVDLLGGAAVEIGMIDAQMRDGEPVRPEAQPPDPPAPGGLGGLGGGAHARQQAPPEKLVPLAERRRVSFRIFERRDVVHRDDLVVHADRAGAGRAPQELAARMKRQHDLLPGMAHERLQQRWQPHGPHRRQPLEQLRRVSSHSGARRIENTGVANDHCPPSTAVAARISSSYILFVNAASPQLETIPARTAPQRWIARARTSTRWPW